MSDLLNSVLKNTYGTSALDTQTNIFDSEKEKKEEQNNLELENTDNILNGNIITYGQMKRNKSVIEAAKRFARDRNNIKQELSDEEAVKNFISHFRSFNVNELTAGGDWNYISGVSADSKRDDTINTTERDLSDIAQKKLDDYTFLYKKFHQLPDFYEEGGAGGAFKDYAYGIASAPSTLVGLIPMFGQVAKGGALAATTAAKIAVSKAVKQAAQKSILKTPLTSLAATVGRHPIKASMLLEGAAGGLQDVSRQNVEMEIGLKDEYKAGETAIGVGAGMAAPAFLGVVGAKKVASAGISKLGKGSKLTESVLKDIDKSILKKTIKANKEANKTLKQKAELKNKLSEVLPALNPDEVAKGTQLGREIIGEKLVPDAILSIDPARTKRILAAVSEMISTNGNIERSFLKNAKDADGNWKIRPTQAVADLLKQKRVGGKTREEFLSEIFEKYNINGDDMANLFLATFSNAGRTLVQAKQFKKLFSDISDDTYDLLGMDLEIKEVFKKAKDLGNSRNARQALEVIDDTQKFRFFRPLDDIRLAAMTSQLGTTVRNTASGYTRIGLDTAVNLVDRGITTVVRGLTLGQKGKGTVSLFDDTPNDDIFSLVFGLTNKTETEAIDSLFRLNFHKQAQTLYRELQDIDNAIGGVGKGNKRLTKARAIGKQLNALNTLSDNYFKRVAFVSSLKKRLNQSYIRTMQELREGFTGKINKTKLKKAVEEAGFNTNLKKAILDGKSIDDITPIVKKEYDIHDMLKGNRFASYINGKQGSKMLNDTIKDTLYFTYQKTPDNPVGKAIINFAHKTPFLTSSLVPFPRFIMNAMRFTYEYSPAYLISPFNNAFRKSLAKDSENYAEVAKGLVGSGALLGAAAYRYHSLNGNEMGGENWWEGRLPNGNTFDLRPFFPAAPYLFVGDLIARAYMGEKLANSRSLTKESFQALSGTQFRAGLGLWIIDEGIEDIFASEKGYDQHEAAGKFAAQYAGNILNTFTIPITPISDIYTTWIGSDDSRIARETKSSDMFSLFINKSISRLPANHRIEEILSKSLGTRAANMYETPLKGEPIRRITPITRQTYGILQSPPKNYLEKEIARMKLDKRLLNRNSGVPEADALINDLIGEWSSTYLSPLLEKSEVYQSLNSDNLKKEFILKQKDAWKGKIVELVEAMQESEARYSSQTGLTLDDEYGFNPLKKKKVETKFTGGDKVYLNQAIELYNKKHGMPQDKLSYDYDLVLLYANRFKEIGDAKLSPLNTMDLQ